MDTESARLRAGEAYELTADGGISHHVRTAHRAVPLKDGDSIDWFLEESLERQRSQRLRSQGFFFPLLEETRMWLVVVLTGVGIGIAGAWLDVLVKWLVSTCARVVHKSDILLAVAELIPWGRSINNGPIRALSQTFIYVSLAIAFAGSAAILVKTYAPYAFHTGIPEIKSILNGYVLDAFLTPWTLLIKALGLALAVASGLSLGKEGPLVHVACCMAFCLSRFFKQFNYSESRRRKLLAAAATAGVSVAFGSPLGGVLFGLEELDTFAKEGEVMWRGFVASAIAAMALQWVNPFGTAKLVLFQVTSGSNTWRGFELVPWITLGVIGGVLGSLLIRINVEVALYRKNSLLRDFPVTEVVAFSALTATISYMVVFCRVQSSELVANLFQECDPAKGDYHGLCNPSAIWENVFLLLLTAGIKLVLTAWTFGMMIPAGIFLPTIAIGACLGRAVGLLTQAFQRAYPKAWMFASCPPDPTVRCISPGFYAVIGAAAMLGGVTRMTISLVVILFELTGALSHVLPIMVSVMTAKFVGDALGKDGIYTVWIAMRSYPWLPSVEPRDQGQTGGDFMRPFEDLVVIEDGVNTVQELEDHLKHWDYRGYPIVDGQTLIGYVTHDNLQVAVDHLDGGNDSSAQTRKCVFAHKSSFGDDGQIDLSHIVDQAVLQLRKDTPQEVVISVFQKLNVRHVMFTQNGKLLGMVTKSDVVSLLTSHFPHSGALATGSPGDWAPWSPEEVEG
ncbi:Cl-channel protein [Fistulina hepatica ATCC 64428]|uniref:Chloride channel protein n=1 Tax=Fistulina hepatica ATCC 64428 TaxID=1128425 RepID=A0A0D6ZZU6_9AGAR|nr:Cl-channel protein [Fistulina hepatica ATCC 64428]